jgi:galactitol-specific phosphotransferase system IIC component
MSKIEKLLNVGTPFFFGMVLIVCGLIMRSSPEKTLYALMAICTGFICLSICCVCSILIKILEK